MNWLAPGRGQLHPERSALSRPVRWKKPKPGDPRQFNIEWNAGTSVEGQALTAVPPLQTAAPTQEDAEVPVLDPGAAKHIDAVPSPNPPKSADSSHPALVQVLPWDFVTTFPEPLPTAIEADLLSDEDAKPENVKSMHEETARQLTGVLTELDRIADWNVRASIQGVG